MKVDAAYWLTLGIGGLLFVGFGAIMFPMLLVANTRAAEQMRWPDIDAEVVHASVTPRLARFEGLRWQHQIAIRYQVGAALPVSGDLLIGSWRTKEEAERALPRLGSTIQIKYSPANPAKHAYAPALIPETDRRVLLATTGTVGAIGGVVAVISAWVIFRRRQNG